MARAEASRMKDAAAPAPMHPAFPTPARPPTRACRCRSERSSARSAAKALTESVRPEPCCAADDAMRVEDCACCIASQSFGKKPREAHVTVAAMDADFADQLTLLQQEALLTPKEADFRQYLVKTGAAEEIVKVLVGMEEAEEKPADAALWPRAHARVEAASARRQRPSGSGTVSDGLRLRYGPRGRREGWQLTSSRAPHSIDVQLRES